MAIQDFVGRGVYSADSDTNKADIAACVRRAEPNDIAAIAEMTHEMEGDNWYYTPGRIAADLDHFFVEGDDEIHGFVRAEPTADPYIILTQVVVRKQFRRTGVATRLLLAMEDIARAAKFGGVINVGPKTPEIFKVYEKLGYKDVGESPYGRILLKEVNNE